jgi:hypothetical protein
MSVCHHTRCRSPQGRGLFILFNLFIAVYLVECSLVLEVRDVCRKYFVGILICSPWSVSVHFQIWLRFVSLKCTSSSSSNLFVSKVLPLFWSWVCLSESDWLLKWNLSKFVYFTLFCAVICVRKMMVQLQASVYVPRGHQALIQVNRFISWHPTSLFHLKQWHYS